MKKLHITGYAFFILSFLASDSSLAQDRQGLRERFRERIQERRAEKQSDGMRADGEATARGNAVTAADLPSGTRIMKDVSYGTHELQTMDVYAPANPQNAPIIIMVHGGGWKRGDKGGVQMVQNRVNYWLPKGFIYISTNYRLHPEVDIPDEADDVAAALAHVQKMAPSWNGDPTKIILMGHSAGAHLVGLLSSDPALARKMGAQRWRGTVVIDSAMMDAVEQMTNKPYKRLGPKIYDEVLGTDPAYWEKVSPYHQLKEDSVPMYIVCSSTRKDACPQAHAINKKALALGRHADVLEQPLSHGAINKNLGLPGAYTESVDRFIQSVLR